MQDGRDHDEAQESSDRVLVRPYIKTEPLPPGEAGTAELPLVDEPGPAAPPATAPAVDPDGRPMAWLIGAGLALIAATIVTIVTLWPGSDEAPSAAPPGGFTWPANDPGRPSAATPSASVRSSPSPSASPSRSSAAPSLRPSTPPPSAPPSATLAPPPAADRVGPILGPGGACLDVSAGIVLPGGVVATRGCNGTLSQRWTVATDGTLRVSGSCAGAGDSGQVTVGGCGSATSGQWRSGPGGTLVNVGSGQCLTGSAEDTRVRVATCGAGGQGWTLP